MIHSDSIADEESAFQTPEHDNETDYGLEFTTSRTSRTTRKCSTLRKNSSGNRAQKITIDNVSSDEENLSPIATPPSRQRQQSSVSNKHNPKQPPATAKSSRRKKNAPEHRLKKLHREIECLQKHQGFLIPRLAFSRLLREILIQHSKIPFKITTGALEAVQTATEMYLTQRFQDAYLLTQYRSRVTLEVRDMALVAYFCKTYGNL
ncbi:histone H3-like centromeric protein cid [Drosophila navojoa]|uniref:histone H3-like centromeric protein cid n=1 Tax=Drosophila navojoa TaxID=7232 RepID=UPI0008473E5B|nr:histone H3-like centromeric protein cid [Drosophila navojoa]